MRIALDTNVLVSAIGTRGLCADLMRLVLGNHDVVVGERVLLELKRNLARKLRLSGDVIEQYDTFLRAQAVAGSADVLVTGDRALQALLAQGELLKPGKLRKRQEECSLAQHQREPANLRRR